jgi:putrescine---pyruvate transaminase
MEPASNNFLKENNARYFLHPNAHPGQMEEQSPRIIVKGEGVWVEDIDGNRVVDGVAGLWSVNAGYGRTEIVDAITAQARQLPCYSAFKGTSTPPPIALSAKLIDLLQPEGMKKVFFSSGGSDGVETALKLARQYWKVVGQRDCYKFISLRQGYHGTHFGGMSVNGAPNFRRPYEPVLPGCIQIDTPWLYRNPYTENEEELGELCAQLLEREIIAQGPDTVAAFSAEPVQGAGGVIVPPANYWPRVIIVDHDVVRQGDAVENVLRRESRKAFKPCDGGEARAPDPIATPMRSRRNDDFVSLEAKNIVDLHVAIEINLDIWKLLQLVDAIIANTAPR